jgi:hypothetical protein
VCWELEKRNLPYQNLEDYSSPEEMYRLGRENFQTVDRICDILDSGLHPQIDTLEGMLKPGHDNFQFIKMLYDALSLRVHLLRSIIGKEQADQVVTIARPGGLGPLPGNYQSAFLDDDSIFSALLDLRGWSCRHVRIDRTGDSLPVGSSRPAGMAEKVRISLKTQSLVLDFRTTAKQQGMTTALGLLGHSLKNLVHGPQFLHIATYSQNWNALLPQLYRQGYLIAHLDAISGKFQGLKRIGELTLPNSLLADFCTRAPVDFSPLFADRLLRLLLIYQELAPPLARAFLEIFKRKPPAALLAGTRSNFREQIPAHIAHRYGIPVISWQHGAAGYFDQPIQFYDELMNSDFHFAWGPSSRDQMAGDELNHFPCRICAVGSMECESIHRKSRSYIRRDYALYVTSMYYLSKFYVGWRYPPRDNALWAAQRMILGCLADHGTPAVFKMHPASSHERHILEFLEGPAFRTITVVRGERRFTELLPHSDFIVIDVPSTVLVQAVATRKPVFVLLSFIRLTEEAGELLEKRAFCYRTPEDLVGALGAYLTERDLDQHPDANNTEFLERYGICSSGEPVGNRALANLNRILEVAPRSPPR